MNANDMFKICDFKNINSSSRLISADNQEHVLSINYSYGCKYLNVNLFEIFMPCHKCEKVTHVISIFSL